MKAGRLYSRPPPCVHPRVARPASSRSPPASWRRRATAPTPRRPRHFRHPAGGVVRTAGGARCWTDGAGPGLYGPQRTIERPAKGEAPHDRPETTRTHPPLSSRSAIVAFHNRDGYRTRADGADRRAAGLWWRVTASVAALCAAGTLWLAVWGVTAASGWTIQAAPPLSGPSGSNGQLAAVWCSSRTSCFAVGSYTDGSGVVWTLAERWNGARWSLQKTPNPPITTSAWLSRISCTSLNACVAIGG